MKTLLTITLLISLSFSNKANILLLPFETSSYYQSNIAKEVHQKSSAMLIKTKRFNIIDRAEFDKVINEQKLNASGIFEEGNIELGKLMNARFIVSGEIIDLTSEHTSPVYIKGEIARRGYYEVTHKFSYKVIDTESGALIASGVLEAKSTEYKEEIAKTNTILPISKKLTDAITNTHQFEAIVLDNSKDITLNIGSNDGLERGIFFNVYPQNIDAIEESGIISTTPICQIHIFKISPTSSKANLSSDTSCKIEKGYFVKEVKLRYSIEAKIIGLTKNKFKIDKGYQSGLQVDSRLKVEIPNKEPVYLKISKVNKQSSTGIFISGNHKLLRKKMIAFETLDSIAPQATIIYKWRTLVKINGGTNKAIRKGDIFTVIGEETTDELIDPETGENLAESKGQVEGLFKITNVYKKYSEGQIMKGWKGIKEGAIATQGGRWKDGWFIKSGVGVLPLAGKYSGDNLKSVLPNGDTVNIDYSSTTPQTVAKALYLSLGSYNRLTRSSYMIDLGLLSMTPTLGAVDVKLSYSYHWPLIPDFTYIYPIGGVGIAFLYQELPSDLLNGLPDSESSSASSLSFSGNIGIGARMSFNRFSIWGEFGYDYFKANNWEYDVENEAYSGDDGESETKGKAIDSELLPYPIVYSTFGYLKFGVMWEAFGSL